MALMAGADLSLVINTEEPKNEKNADPKKRTNRSTPKRQEDAKLAPNPVRIYL
jgi:hypothetical protein